MTHKFTRRQFLATSATAGFGVWVAHSTLGQPAARAASTNKLTIGVIGVANRGNDNLRGVDSENIVALCDVDETYLGKAAQRFPAAKQYNDWRKMLEQKDIEAVVVSTTDHHHAHATVAALQLGKHVYCEKPLTHSVWEIRQVQAAARRAGKATQMGTQIHAGDNYRRVVELIKAGAIGAVNRVHVWVGGYYNGGKRPQDTPPVPSTLHWDLWLGPAPERPYHPAYHPARWRSWWDFGGGMLADMACHHIDVAHWALDLRYPSTVEAEGPAPDPECPPKWLIVNYRYPARGAQPPVHLTWYHGDRRPPQFAEGKLPKWGNGVLFIGDKGMLITDYDKHRLLPEDQFKDYKRPAQSIPASIGHHEEWIKACKEGTSTTCNFDYAGALTETVLLGNVAHRSGKRIEWNVADLKTGAPEADAFLRRQYRKGWDL